MELYKQGKYDQAKERFERAKECRDIPADSVNILLEVLNSWIKKCNNPPVIQEILKVSPSKLLFTSTGEYETVNITSSGKWQVERLPSWCKVHEEKSTVLKIYCEKNEKTVSRSDSLIIVMGSRSAIVYFEQEAANAPAKTTGKIRFQITPNHAFIDFGTGEKQQLTDSYMEMEKEAKKYNVQITKDGYLPIDTLVTVSNDGNAVTLDIVLKPLFSLIQLDITAADGLPFQEYPVIRINANKITYNNSNLESFNDVNNIEYFKLYKDGYIPVPSGVYNIDVSADKFETYTQEIKADRGDTAGFKIQLKPVSGYLTVTDNGGATGAKVFLNDRQIGVVDVDMFKKELRTGAYKLRFEKDGFLTPEKEYAITIKEKTEENFPISMTTFNQYRFTSVPSAAEIFVNGNREGFTPANVSLKEGNNEIVIKKTGYWSYKKTITVNKGVKDQATNINAELQQTFPVKITSEKDSVNIVIKKDGEIIASELIAGPTELLLPQGKYRLKSYEYGKKSNRYSGNFTHNTTNRDTTILKVPFYSWGTFTTLVGDYFITRPEAESKLQTGMSENYYNLMADLHFGRFNVFPGFSTSIFRTSMFNINSPFKGTSVETNVDGNNNNNINYPDYLFSASCLFLNGEFRIGGYLSRYVGVSVLGSYAWYPDLRSFLPLSHIDGQEIFVGLEVTSRIINYFNVNFKLGKEIYKGNYNILLDKKQKDINEKFFSNSFDLDSFVFKVGFSLGRKKTRGNNIWRVW
jgi:hypothetical protein